jgi:hypothetical protein
MRRAESSVARAQSLSEAAEEQEEASNLIEVARRDRYVPHSMNA